MTFEKGSLILVDYTMRAKDSDAVIETTSEEDAKAGSIHEPDVLYVPRLVSVGEANYPVLKGFAEGLVEMSVGERKAIEVGPEKAWARATRRRCARTRSASSARTPTATRWGTTWSLTTRRA